MLTTLAVLLTLLSTAAIFHRMLTSHVSTACCCLQNPVGVAVGATAGHALATALAVAGGALAGKYISEKTVNLVSGILFLLFAAATVYTML
jgi:putative Ca2+/H+ antiporter (TMEM165/GDT1 family)